MRLDESLVGMGAGVRPRCGDLRPTQSVDIVEAATVFHVTRGPTIEIFDQPTCRRRARFRTN